MGVIYWCRVLRLDFDFLYFLTTRSKLRSRSSCPPSPSSPAASAASSSVCVIITCYKSQPLRTVRDCESQPLRTIITCCESLSHAFAFQASGFRFRAKREQLETFCGLQHGSQGQNLVCVPRTIWRRTRLWHTRESQDSTLVMNFRWKS